MPTTAVATSVIVTFNPEDHVLLALKSVREQVRKVVVVDNGSRASAVALLRRAAAADSAVELVELPENVGQAAALNLGISRSIDLGASYAFLLDDDSIAGEGCVAALVDLARTSGSAVTAARWVTGGGIQPPPPPDRVPTAGSLIELAAWRNVGPFRDEYFIDYVDYDFCVRAIKSGRRVLIHPDAYIRQRGGRPHVRRFLWRRTTVSNYPAFRLYFMTRNGLALYAREQRNWRLLLWHLRMVGARAAKVMLYEDTKAGKLWAIAVGLIDGLRGRLGTGRYDPRRFRR